MADTDTSTDPKGGPKAKAAAEEPAAVPAVKLIRATVAPGRTVVAHAPDAQPTDRPKHHGPGADVHLEEADYRRLLAAGYLVNPTGTGPLIAEGPATLIEKY